MDLIVKKTQLVEPIEKTKCETKFILNVKQTLSWFRHLMIACQHNVISGSINFQFFCDQKCLMYSYSL